MNNQTTDCFIIVCLFVDRSFVVQQSDLGQISAIIVRVILIRYTASALYTASAFFDLTLFRLEVVGWCDGRG